MEHTSYSMQALWQQSDFVIKSVAFILLFMSIASWTVILVHSLRLWYLRQRCQLLPDFWHSQNFQKGIELFGAAHTNNVFRQLAEDGEAAVAHYQTSQQDLHGQLPLSQWLTNCLRTSMDDSINYMQRGLPILASVGSTAPFIGLFGTVWGIYHALISLGGSGQVGIDQVAGPVGEALVMTAFGLIVAIPAVLGYNALIRGQKNVINHLNRYAQQLHTYFLTGSTLIERRPSTVRHIFSKPTNKGGV